MRLLLIILILSLSGCGRSTPLQSRGKPVTHWLESLQDRDASVRKKAVVALGHVGDADPAAIPAVMGAVKDKEAVVRRQAVLALLNLGARAKEAEAVLTEAQTDRDAQVRAYALKALERIQAK
jgi:HEAT repeat protein